MMHWRTLRRLTQGLGVMALAGTTLLTLEAGGARAASGYGGPPPPPPPSVPGGFFTVVTSVTIGPAGGTIGSVRVGALHVKLRIPAGAFPVRVQITLTAPNVAGIGSGGFAGFLALGGVGIQVQENGSPYPGTFLKPLLLKLTSPPVKHSAIAVVWNGTRFVTVPTATVRHGLVQLTFDTDPDFAVLTPTSPIQGATSAATGKPVLGEAILAGTLILLGGGGLMTARRRRLPAETKNSSEA